MSPAVNTMELPFRLPRLLDNESIRLEPAPKRFYVYFRPPLWLNKLNGRVMVMVEATDETTAIDVAISSGVHSYVEPDYGSSAFVFDGVEPA